MLFFLLRLAFVLAILCTGLSSMAQSHQGPEDSPRDRARDQLHRLFQEAWEWELEQDPLWASYLGDKRYNDRWPDISLTALEARAKKREEFLSRLRGINRELLAPDDLVSYRIFERWYENKLGDFRHGWHFLSFNQREGIQNIDTIADALTFESQKDYRDWLKRLDSFPRFMDQTIELLREGIRRGRVHPRVVMERIPAQIRRQIVADPKESPFYAPFREMPGDLSPDVAEQLRREAQHLIRAKVVPSYRRFLEFFEKEYLPATLPRPGIWQLPGGKEMYAFLARKFTTTDLTPEQIHEIGVREVERIRGEMEKVMKSTGFEGSFKEFLQFLRTDPRFYTNDPEHLLMIYRATCKRIDPELVRLFGRLPRMPYGVEPIPEHVAPDTTTAYYREPAADGSRAGTYFVNLYKPETRPLYEVEVLSVHEAVPGHHLQIALAMELTDLPAFRRYTGATAFIEGWALYSESLGEELGLYRDPYSKFGQLTYEMWRAVRLVVDTGIHWYGWSREQAIDYFLENTAKSRLDIENEVDRYIAWPGQALAYKIGELEIKKLRREAEEALGEDFDVRAFHDVVLGAGAVPLDVLRDRVETWIESRRSRSPE